MIESYGFDRGDLEVDYKPAIPEHGRKRADIAIFQPGSEHTNENLQRVVVCKTQKKSDKLRSPQEAERDLSSLRELMGLLPSVALGMWTNKQEEFLFRAERTRFEVRFNPLGVWPAPGEHTNGLDKTGGVIQVSADGPARIGNSNRLLEI